MKNMLNNLFFSVSVTTGMNTWIHSNLILWVASHSKTKVHYNDKSYCEKLKENKNILFFLILHFYILNPQLKPSEISCALECPQGSKRCHAQLNLHQVICTEEDGTFTFHHEAGTLGLLTIFQTGLVRKGAVNHSC